MCAPTGCSRRQSVSIQYQCPHVCAGEGDAAGGAEAPGLAAGASQAQGAGAPNQAQEAGAQAGGLLRSVSAPETHLRAEALAAVRPSTDLALLYRDPRS